LCIQRRFQRWSSPLSFLHPARPARSVVQNKDMHCSTAVSGCFRWMGLNECLVGGRQPTSELASFALFCVVAYWVMLDFKSKLWACEER
jgi:hypothetical protein